MNKLLKQIMAVTYDMDSKDPNGVRRNVESARLEIIDKAKNSYMYGYTREEIEDAFMEALLYVYERQLVDEDYKSKLSVSSITFKMREIAKRAKYKSNGYTTRGTTPKSGRYLHVQNMYDSETGENQVEKMGYDQDGNLLIGN